MEVWLPNGNDTAWNGRTMSTDNGGLNGCVHYVDMQYVSGLGFAAIGDNGGHNSSSFDGTWSLNNNGKYLLQRLATFTVNVPELSWTRCATSYSYGD